MATRRQALKNAPRTKKAAKSTGKARAGAVAEDGEGDADGEEDADSVEGAEGDGDDTMTAAEDDTAEGAEGADDDAGDDDDEVAPAARAARAERRRCAALVDAAAVAEAPPALVAKAIRTGQSAESFMRTCAAAKRAAATGGPGPVRGQHGASGKGVADNHGWAGAIARVTPRAASAGQR